MERLQVFINGKRTLKNERKQWPNKGDLKMARKKIETVYTYKEWKRIEREQNISAFLGGLLMLVCFMVLITIGCII